MVRVPELTEKEKAGSLEITAEYRKKLKDAVHTLSMASDAKTMQRVPLTRILNPLDWRTKLLISFHKFLPGAILGVLGSLATTIASGGIGAIGWGAFAVAGIYGILGGLGLTTGKYVKETLKDKKLDKEVRKPEILRAEGYNSAQMEWVANIISIAMGLAKAANLDTHAALRHVYTSLALIGDIPKEVGEFLLTVSAVVEDGTARGGFTAAEIQSVLNEAVDIKEAALRIQTLWDER